MNITMHIDEQFECSELFYLLLVSYCEFPLMRDFFAFVIFVR